MESNELTALGVCLDTWVLTSPSEDRCESLAFLSGILRQVVSESRISSISKSSLSSTRESICSTVDFLMYPTTAHEIFPLRLFARRYLEEARDTKK